MNWKKEVKKEDKLSTSDKMLNDLTLLEEDINDAKDYVDMLNRKYFGFPLFMAAEIISKLEDVLYNIKQEKDAIRENSKPLTQGDKGYQAK